MDAKKKKAVEKTLKYLQMYFITVDSNEMELKYKITEHGITEVQISPNCKTKSEYSLIIVHTMAIESLYYFDLSIFYSALA